jgi:hypothetical protein
VVPGHDSDRLRLGDDNSLQQVRCVQADQHGIGMSQEAGQQFGVRHRPRVVRRGSAGYSGADPIIWSDVRDPTDALQIYPTAAGEAMADPQQQ